LAAPVDDLLFPLQTVGRCFLKSTGSVVEGDSARHEALLLLIELCCADVLRSLPLVCDAIAVIRDSISAVGQPLSLVGDLLSSVQSKRNIAKVANGCFPLLELQFSLI
jgi:hypothetical protein